MVELDMKKYLVGGAVRDRFIPTQIKDHDWVWTGATPKMMEEMGFKQVGADFPVFLDENGEEHALARTERKTGPGYNGFVTDFDPSITIEDDLERRDLTMNAMAFCVTDDPDYLNLIDPFFGQQDIRDRVLRHVSNAFREDPVRVLRVARFAARYNFSVAPETMQLMKDMVRSGEVDHLTPERVWSEMDRAVMEDHAVRFFEVLHECGALGRIFKVNRNGPVEHNTTVGQFAIPTDNGTVRLNMRDLRTACALNMPASWMRWVCVAFHWDAMVTARALEELRAPNEVCDRIQQAFGILALKNDMRRNSAFEVDIHNFMKHHRLNNDHQFNQLRETCAVLAQADSHMTDIIVLILEAIAAGRTVWADTIRSKFPPGEEPKGKELGDAIAAEQKKRIRKYLDE